jgi:hypothetical protein
MHNYQDLQLIADYLDSSNDKVEKENICRDLSLFISRIQSKEYQHTDILSRQTFDTPRRTFEFFNYLISYFEQASHWVGILKQIPMQRIKRVIDFCPGSSPKVQWALQRLHYTQHLSIVDNDVLALNQLKVLLKIFDAPYQATFIHSDIFSVPGKYDLVTANHIFDDLVLNEFCVAHHLVLRKLYADEKLFKDALDKIQANNIPIEFIDRFVRFIDERVQDNGYLVMTHYLGLTECALNLKAWSLWIKKIMDIIYESFLGQGYTLISGNVTEYYPSSEKHYFILHKQQ